MIYNLSNEIELKKARLKLEHSASLKKHVELKTLSDKRTSLQNRALHKFFVLISQELNELGQTFKYFGLKGQILETRYTPEVVKNYFWRPIQKALFEIESTKDLNTKQMNEIIDVTVKYFGDKGIYIEFPNKETLNDM